MDAHLRGGDRVALVTGANRDLGFETARQLLAKGYSVALAGRDAAALDRAQGSLSEPERRRAVTVQMDVTSVKNIAATERAVTAQMGPVNVLVNNAAILLAENDDVLSIRADDYRRTFDTNLFGVIEICRACDRSRYERYPGRDLRNAARLQQDRSRDRRYPVSPFE